MNDKFDMPDSSVNNIWHWIFWSSSSMLVSNCYFCYQGFEKFPSSSKPIARGNIQLKSRSHHMISPSKYKRLQLRPQVSSKGNRRSMFFFFSVLNHIVHTYLWVLVTAGSSNGVIICYAICSVKSSKNEDTLNWLVIIIGNGECLNFDIWRLWWSRPPLVALPKLPLTERKELQNGVNDNDLQSWNLRIVCLQMQMQMGIYKWKYLAAIGL